MVQCKATSKQSGQRCKRAAAKGREVCVIHGGKSPGAPIKHGRYSKYGSEKLAAKIEDFKQGDALDLSDELATQRALLAEYMTRFETMSMTRDDIGTIMGWFDSVGRMAERINKMRNEDTLTAVEVAALQARAVDMVMRYFDDPKTRRQFLSELFGISEGDTTGGENRAGHAGAASRLVIADKADASK